jgi:hypothetical protein
MKNLFLILMLFHCAATCWSQSFLGATVGVDYAKIKQTEATQPFKDDGFVIWNEGYSVRSLFYGIQGEKHLSKKISIAINLLYTKKEMGASNGFFIPIEGIKFNSFSGTVSGKWYPVDYFYFGTGVSFSYLSNVRSYIKIGTEYQIELENKKKYGHLISLGFRYKNFLIGPYFVNGLNIGKKSDNVDLNPIDSFGFSLSYMLKVSKEKRR